MVSFVILGKHLRLLFLQLLLLLLLNLAQAVLVDRSRHRLRLDLSADDVRLRNEPRPRLRDVERLELRQLLLGFAQYARAIGCLDGAGGPVLYLVHNCLELIFEALHFADDVLLHIINIIELAPLHFDPLLQLLDAQCILHEGVDGRRSSIATDQELPKLGNRELLEAEEKEVGEDRIKILLSSKSRGRAFVHEAGNKKLQELLVAHATIEDLMNKLQLGVPQLLVFEARGILHVCVDRRLFVVIGFNDLNAFLQEIRAMLTWIYSVFSRP
mmetsp:Transcript_20694/g.48335  ORF Transcript_20694/g.48335 Transcript_20694/m.48335 type:complete len:271 (+) Transcript_20694:1464-2276(+)